MTTAHAGPPAMSEDAAISAAVWALLAERGESVADLAYHTRISTASLYRKLGGQASWKAADIGAVGRHFGVQPNDLFSGRPRHTRARRRREVTVPYLRLLREPTSTYAAARASA